MLLEQNLLAVGRIEETRQPVEGGGEIVPVVRFGHAGMQRHAHPQRSRRIAPVLGQQRALAGRRRPQRLFRRGKAAWVPSPTVL